MDDFIVIIPSRLKSTRLPEKALKDINGKTLIQRVYEQAIQSKAKEVIVATDHKKISDHCKSIGAKFLMTSDQHKSGTDRIAECIELLKIPDDQIIVNLQGDEPFVIPEHINLLAECMSDGPNLTFKKLEERNSFLNPELINLHMRIDFSTIQIVIPTERNDQSILTEERRYQHLVKINEDINAVKVVSEVVCSFINDTYLGVATGFSRAGVTSTSTPLDAIGLHVGIYAYPAKFVTMFSNTEQSLEEKIENLEQLRFYRKYIEGKPSFANVLMLHSKYFNNYVGVDTEEDIYRAIEIAKKNEN